MSPLGHFISVLAIWTKMLFGLRFAAGVGKWLTPLGFAGWKLAYCQESGKHVIERAEMIAGYPMSVQRALVAGDWA